MGYASIPTDISGKLNKLPDYDSGCFSLAATSYVEKTHNFNTRDLIIQVNDGESDNNCANDAINGAGRPEIYYNIDIMITIITCSSANNIEIKNHSGSTRHYRIFMWKVV